MTMQQQRAQKRAAKLKARGYAGGPAQAYGTLEAWRQPLESFSPPSGSFDPEGSWKQSYAVWLQTGLALPAGFLEVQREVSSGGVILTVECCVVQMAAGKQQTKARLVCDAGPLCSPKSWDLEAVALDDAGQPVARTRVVERAVVKGGAIEAEMNGRKRTVKIPLPFTSNWAVFDIIQHLPAKDAAPLQFAVLEDLDLPKPNQRISFFGAATVNVAGGRQLALTGYEQIGEGILPFYYWRDESRRLLLAVTGPRAYIYDPDARKRVMQEKRAGGRRNA
jgi:hypothetical protein